jgi:hypothetical protein
MRATWAVYYYDTLGNALDRPHAVGSEQYAKVQQALSDELSEIELYNFPNWDTFGAEPITHETVEVARRFRDALPLNWQAPDIAPASDGTIGFEWRVADEIACVDVGPGDVIQGHKVRSDCTSENWPKTDLANADSLIDCLDSFISS